MFALTSGRPRFNRWMLIVIGVVLLVGIASGATGDTVAQTGHPPGCFPTCDADDSRFLSIAGGTNLVTLTGQSLTIEIAVKASEDGLDLGVFDGETTPLAQGGNWDIGDKPLEFRLYASPTGDPGDDVLLDTFSGADMDDDAWWVESRPFDTDALGASGNYFYRLDVELLDASTDTSSNFKLAVNGSMNISEPFSFISEVMGADGASSVFPSYPDHDSTYDGTFTFFMRKQDDTGDFVVWDGDLDRGKFDGTEQDTNDPDTPDSPYMPTWAVSQAKPEGVAIGQGGLTSAPPDDRNPFGFGIYFLRSPSVEYQLETAAGDVFTNDNPSGNQEWEQFRLSTDSDDINPYDALATSLPAGIYKLSVSGMDISNLNAWKGEYVTCVDDTGEPCEDIPRTIAIGDYVWFDANNDHMQTAGETGISGVTVNLYLDDGDGLFDPNLDFDKGTTTTDANGFYLFEGLSAGDYFVAIPSTEFGTGNYLDGLTSVNANVGADDVDSDGVFDTPLNLVSHKVELSTASDLTVDFGLVETSGSSNFIGNRVWLDLTVDGIFEPIAETPVAGVVVNAYFDWNGNDTFDAGDIYVGSGTTDGSGEYLISASLGDGTYFVKVDPSATATGGVLEGKTQSSAMWPYGSHPDTVDANRDQEYAYAVEIAGADNKTADFAYLDEEICIEEEVIPPDEPDTDVGAYAAVVLGQSNFGTGLEDSITIRVTIKDTFTDAHYGSCAEDPTCNPYDPWKRGFHQIVNSDKMQYMLWPNNPEMVGGVPVPVFDVIEDLLYEDNKAPIPTPFDTGCVGHALGKQNDGLINREPVGTPEGDYLCRTSAAENYNSVPWTDQTSSPTEAQEPDFIHDEWYELTVPLSYFDSLGGFSHVEFVILHASPNKTGTPEYPVTECIPL